MYQSSIPAFYRDTVYNHECVRVRTHTSPSARWVPPTSGFTYLLDRGSVFLCVKSGLAGAQRVQRGDVKGEDCECTGHDHAYSHMICIYTWRACTRVYVRPVWSCTWNPYTRTAWCIPGLPGMHSPDRRKRVYRAFQCYNPAGSSAHCPQYPAPVNPSRM